MGNGTKVTNPFKVGDVVYHLEFGKGTVTGTESERGVSYPVAVRWYNKEIEPFWCRTDTLSFKPWPKPCHERPIEDGWWVVALDGFGPLLRQLENGVMYDHQGYAGDLPQSRYTFLRHLGEKLY